MMQGQLPDIYCEGANIGVNDFGVAVTPVRFNPMTQKPEGLLTLRLSITAAKLVAFQLRQSIKATEREMGLTSQVNQAQLRANNIPQEDWEGFWK